MEKKLSGDELWNLLTKTGIVPSRIEYLKKEAEGKEVALICDDVDGLLGGDDHPIFNVIVSLPHILSCDRCRTKYRKKREEQ